MKALLICTGQSSRKRRVFIIETKVAVQNKSLNYVRILWHINQQQHLSTSTNQLSTDNNTLQHIVTADLFSACSVQQLRAVSKTQFLSQMRREHLASLANEAQNKVRSASVHMCACTFVYVCVYVCVRKGWVWVCTCNSIFALFSTRTSHFSGHSWASTCLPDNNITLTG